MSLYFEGNGNGRIQPHLPLSVTRQPHFPLGAVDRMARCGVPANGFRLPAAAVMK